MTLIQFDKTYLDKYSLIAGLDEAGRGAWAGPVVAAAVIMPQNQLIADINDSKKLSANKREELYDKIVHGCVTYGVGMVSPEIIDDINILEATKRAMLMAIAHLSAKPDLLLIDGNMSLASPLKQEAVIDGDAKSYCIAAASIIAKVTRDRIMAQLARVFPEYQFEKHKGYGTPAHQNALKEFGTLTIHRKSYKPIQRIVQKDF